LPSGDFFCAFFVPRRRAAKEKARPRLFGGKDLRTNPFRAFHVETAPGRGEPHAISLFCLRGLYAKQHSEEQ
jgi:hypothetical protein